MFSIMGDQAIHVKLFGMLIEKVGKGQIVVPHMKDVDSLKVYIHDEYDVLADCIYILAVNKKVVRGNIPLHVSDEIALLPPFSGG